MIKPKEIGQRLRELRGNMSLDDVSKACGISKSAIQMYECGARVPRDEIKIRLANYFNTSVEALFFKI